MSKRPLDDEVSRAQREADEAAAVARIAEAKLQALLKAQRELFAAYAEEDGLREHRPSVNTRSEQMQIEKRIAISEGRSAKSKDPFFDAIRSAKPKGFTLRSLATRLGCEASLLSMQRKGDRPIPTERAKLIEELTGWPADKKHWPGGLS